MILNALSATLDCTAFEARTILYIAQIYNNARHCTPYIYTMPNVAIKATINLLKAQAPANVKLTKV